MQVFYIALVAFLSCVSAAPKEKRSPYFFNPYSFAFGGFGGRPFAGAFSQAGLGFPFYQPIPWVPFPMPDFSQFTEWYKGPNVCKVDKVIEEPDEIRQFMSEGGPSQGSFDFNHESESCRGDNDVYVCMKWIQTPKGTSIQMTKYSCCYGYTRTTDGSPGCVEIDLRNLTPTLRNMGATQMVKVIEKVGMSDDFHNNNYTVFCPPNSALEQMQKNVEDEIDNEITIKRSHQKVKKKARLYNIVTSHLSPGFFKTDDMMDGNILQTDNLQCKIRINVYFTPIKIITANCVPILSGDHFARNGIVHVVEKLLPMPVRTVADVIAGDTQFSILKRMLGLAGLVQTLRNASGTYTMFAPTDSAFKSVLHYQTGSNDNRCTVSLMKHHIIDHVICSSAVPQHVGIMNTIGELLSVSRDENNKLYVDDVQIVVRDLMATNGVVHIIDGILSTSQTKPVSHALDEYGLYEFVTLLEEASLKSEFDNLDNVTFFIPSDEVMQSIPPRHLDALLKYNNHSLQDVLRFHVANGQTELKPPDQMLESKLKNSSIRFQVYMKYPEMTSQVLAQCANVLNANIKICGGTVHVIDKLLLPPKLTIIEFLESVEGFSTLILLLRVTGLDRRLRVKESAFTLFAPTDDAFHQMGEEAIFRLLSDVERATDVVKMHIVLGSVCCNQLNNNLLSGRHQTRTMEGSPLNLERSTDNILMAGGAHIVDCDIIATNGVIHMVDTVLSHDSASYFGGGFLDNLLIFV